METAKGVEGISPHNAYTSISSGIHISSSMQKVSVPEKDENITHQGEDHRNFIIPIDKKFKIRIYKPLILLKLALFVWYGAAAAMTTFLIVFIKQKGMTLTELSTVYIMATIGQFLGPIICGIIADRIGSSKPLLIFNIILNIVTAISLIVSPSLNLVNYDHESVILKCHQAEFYPLLSKSSCDIGMDDIDLTYCKMDCFEKVTQFCHGQNLICDILKDNADLGNFSLNVHVSYAYKDKSKCYYNVTSISYRNVTYLWCSIPHNMYCAVSCSMKSYEDSSTDNSGRSRKLILNMVLLILLFAEISNTYRFFDVTAMNLVKEHNSNFGRERFFAIAGIMVFSPFAGYVVGATRNYEGDVNYDTAFYFFIGMNFILFLILYKLQVQIKPPGKNLWRKSFYLLKNPDIVFFITVLIVLGTAWGFTKNYVSLYLKQMEAPSFLLGLLGAIGALYGLPFYLTSYWWMRNIGATQIFVLSLLGYVASDIGYSLLYDPWFALLIEATTIITYHMLWVAVVEHSHSIAPEGFTTTVVTGAGGLHYCIGKGTGGLYGALVIEAYGGRVAHRIMAGICFVTAVLYAIYLYLRWIRCPVNAAMDGKNGVKTQEEEEVKTMSSQLLP